MTPEHTKQCEIITDNVINKVDELEGRFDSHLQVYANNGKESARVAAVLERLEIRSKERDEKVDEMFKVYQSFKFGKMGITWAFGICMAVGSAFLLIKNLFLK